MCVFVCESRRLPFPAMLKREEGSFSETFIL